MIALLLACAPRLDLPARAREPGWSVAAVRYARSSAAPAARLLAAPSTPTVPMAWSFFVVAGNGKLFLVDAGTSALASAGGRALAADWGVDEAVSVPTALGRVGVAPADVDGVVLTHVHWDHADGLRELPRVQVWRGAATRFEVEPGIAVLPGGAHVANHSAVVVACAEGPVAIAGDLAYFADKGGGFQASPATTDPAADREAMAQLVSVVGSADRVLLGHDPALEARWPSAGEGVSVVCR